VTDINFKIDYFELTQSCKNYFDCDIKPLSIIGQKNTKTVELD